MIAFRTLVDSDLPTVSAWFEDAETRHWLGDWHWPKGKLRLSGPGRQTVLALVDNAPAALVDIEIGAEDRAAFAIVVAPQLRGHGLGRAIVEACVADARFATVTEWLAGVETGNVASQQLLLSAGFARMTDVDADGFSYYARRRSGWPRLPWQTPWADDRGARPRLTAGKLGASRTAA